jgi:SAM-dependent methyltransferase
MKDYLGLSLQDLPYFRALLRAVEARFYDELNFSSPVIDIGCGDGHFGGLVFDSPIDIGIDPWWKAIQEAQKSIGYHSVMCANSSALPFPSRYFGSGLSNSVLEHIPEIDRVIAEIARVLQPGSPFVFCVPNHRFLDSLSIGRFLNRIGLRPLGNTYRNLFNRISRIAHCDEPAVWITRFERYGLHVEENWDYFPPSALKTLEWGHYFGVPSLVSKKLFGKWVLAPNAWNMMITERIVRRHYDQPPRCEDGVYTFYISRKIG